MNAQARIGLDEADEDLTHWYVPGPDGMTRVETTITSHEAYDLIRSGGALMSCPFGGIAFAASRSLSVCFPAAEGRNGRPTHRIDLIVLRIEDLGVGVIQVIACRLDQQSTTKNLQEVLGFLRSNPNRNATNGYNEADLERDDIHLGDAARNALAF